MLGTNLPSITSKWIQSAPASSTAFTSAPSSPKLADRIEGHTITSLLLNLATRSAPDRVTTRDARRDEVLPADTRADDAFTLALNITISLGGAALALEN